MRQKTQRTSDRKLKLERETLRRLEEGDLREVAAGAPTNSPICNFSEPSACATCLCTR